eukprot:2287895-Rhodomonas_salina.1
MKGRRARLERSSRIGSTLRDVSTGSRLASVRLCTHLHAPRTLVSRARHEMARAVSRGVDGVCSGALRPPRTSARWQKALERAGREEEPRRR